MATETFYLPPGAQAPISPYDHHIQSRSTSSSPTYENSHTACPLLPKDEEWSPLDSSSYYFPDGVQPNAASALSFDSQTEKRSSWPRLERMHRRLQTLKRAMSVIELILLAWSTYTVVRYFLAYTVSRSITGQITNIVLGGVSTLAVPLIISLSLFRAFEHPLLAQELSLGMLMNTTVVLILLVSTCIMGPAITNFVFLFLWRSGVEKELDISRKCHFDIDVVWQTSSSCASSPWGVWLGLGIVRLVLTAGLLIIYCVFAHSYRKLRRSASPATQFSGPDYHYKRTRLRSQASERTAVAPSPPRSPSTALPPAQPSSPPRSLRHQSSPSSSTVNTKQTIRSVTTSSGYHTSNTLSDDVSSSHTLTEGWQQQQSSQLPPDTDVNSFADRFRSLVTQVDEAIQYARSPEPEDPEDRYTALPPRSFHSGFHQAQNIGYDEHGLPYPPDEHIPMLNGYVRRMPTIESFGSREFATTSVGSSLYAYDSRFGSANSRPPTQLTMRSAFSDLSSEPMSPSRGNSWHLNLQPIDDADRAGEPSPSTSGPSFVTAGSSVYESSSHSTRS